MKFKQWAWLLASLVLPLLVLACGDGGPEPPPPPIPEREPPFPEKEPASLATPATAEEELLASMVLTVEEVGEVFPDQGWRVFTQPQEFFGEEPPLGWVAAWIASYNPEQVADVLEVTTLLLLFETAEDASEQFLDSRSAEEPGPAVKIEQFDAGGIGDEARGQVNRTPEVYTSVLLRVDRVLVDISIPLGLTNENRREEARQLAQKLAVKIEAAIQGQATY